MCRDFFPTIDKHIERSHTETLQIDKRIDAFLNGFKEFKRLHKNLEKVADSFTPAEINGISLTNKGYGTKSKSSNNLSPKIESRKALFKTLSISSTM